MSNLYDEIMQLLHESNAFERADGQERVRRLARHAKEIAETEFPADVVKGYAKLNSRAKLLGQ